MSRSSKVLLLKALKYDGARVTHLTMVGRGLCHSLTYISMLMYYQHKSIPTCITYQHTLHTHMHYIPIYITYPHTFHIPVHSISPYIPYPHTCHAPLHSMPPYIPYPCTFHTAQTIFRYLLWVYYTYRAIFIFPHLIVHVPSMLQHWKSVYIKTLCHH